MFEDNVFAREQSTSAELYKFTFSNGSALYFTSFERDLLTTETHDGHAYTHIPIQRGEFENDDALASNKMQLTAPVLNTFANSLISGGQIFISITKLFLVDKTYQMIFNGLVLSIEKNIGEAIAQCASKLYFLEKELPRVFFQSACNNTLFDTKCTMLKANYQFDNINAVVSNNGYTVTIGNTDWVSIRSAFVLSHGIDIPDGTGTLNGLWTLGQVTWKAADGGTGEIRFVTNHTARVLQLHYPFTGKTSGAIVISLLPGCDKTGLYCSSVFGGPDYPPGNIVNFTGFPYMPAADPTIMAVGTT
jgi:Uncharacterized conserved protein (DUF2163)/Phage conserved hypothetical protein BR0599